MSQAGDSFYAFRERGLNDWLEQRNRDIREEIEEEPENYILSVNETEYVNHLGEKYRLDFPTIDFAHFWIEDCEKVIPHDQLQPWADHLHAGRSYRRSVLVCYLPFRGDADLLKWKPNGGRLWERELTVAREERDAKEYLCFEVICFVSVDKGKQEVAEVIDNIKVQVEALAPDVIAYNEKVEECARQALQGRKARIHNRRQQVDALDMPVKRRDAGAPEQAVEEAPGYTEDEKSVASEETKEHRYAFFSIDVVNSQGIAANADYHPNDIQKTISSYRKLTYEEASKRHMTTAQWAGDGGVILFRGEESPHRAFDTALAVLLAMSDFNARNNTIGEALDIRIAVHTDFLKLPEDPSELEHLSINLVDRLQKEAVPNTIVVTEEVYRRLCRHSKDKLTRLAAKPGDIQLYCRGRYAEDIVDGQLEIPLAPDSLVDFLSLRVPVEHWEELASEAGIDPYNWVPGRKYNMEATSRLLCVLHAIGMSTIANFDELLAAVEPRAQEKLGKLARLQKERGFEFCRIPLKVLAALVYLFNCKNLPKGFRWEPGFGPEVEQALKDMCRDDA